MTQHRTLTAACLSAILCLASPLLAATPNAIPDPRCGLGDIVPGTTWPAGPGEFAYASGAPKLFKPPTGVKVWRLKDNRAEFQQFVYVRDDKVYAVAREYDGDQEEKVLEALRSRYGKPANPGIETGKMGLVTGKVQSRTIWIDASCGTRVEFIHQDSAMFKGKVNKSVRVGVVVTLADKRAPGDSPNPLE